MPPAVQPVDQAAGSPSSRAEEPVPRWPAAPALAGLEPVGPVGGEAAALSRGAVAFMGGHKVFKALPQTRSEIHGVLVSGVPYAVLVNLVAQTTALSPQEVADAVGISTRTLRRHQDHPDKPMPPDLASKTWQFAETLARASQVFGNREAAERWMAKPAMALDGARPVDLMRTLQGAELVAELLGRLALGVYT